MYKLELCGIMRFTGVPKEAEYEKDIIYRR